MKHGFLCLGLTLSFLMSPVQAQQDCDRACLEGYVSTYLDALYANTPDAVPLARRARVSRQLKIPWRITPSSGLLP